MKVVDMATGSAKLAPHAGYKGYYSAEHHSAQNEYDLTEVQIAKIRAVLTNWNMGGTGDLIPRRT